MCTSQHGSEARLAPAPRVLKPLFRRLGVFVAQNSVLTIVLAILVTGVCAAGAALTVKSSGYTAWFPLHSRVNTDQSRIEQYFEATSRASRVILEEKVLGTALTADALVEANAFHADLIGSSGQPALFEQLCVRQFTGGPCVVHSVLSAWQFNSSRIAADTKPALTLLGNALPLQLVLGGEGWNSDVQHASALQFVYELDADAISDSNITAADFERDFWIPACLSTQLTHYNVFCNADRSWKDENVRSQGSKLTVGIAVVGMVAYVMLVIGRCHCVQSRVLLGLSILLSVGMALAVAFGIAGYAGVPFTIMSFMAVFIIMGVGIDDMFILIDAFDRAQLEVQKQQQQEQEQEQEQEQQQAALALALNNSALGAATTAAATEQPQDELSLQLGVALESVGTSIALTSLTDFLAFCIGSTIDLPAISAFCLTAGIAVLAVFAIQCTFFAAILVLDRRRAKANRYDLLPCVVAKTKAAQEREEGVGKGETSTGKDEASQPKVTTRLLSALSRTLHPSPRYRAATVAFFALLTVVMGGVAYAQLTKGVDFRAFMPGDSYVLDFLQAEDKGFRSLVPVAVYTFGDFDVNDPAHLSAMRTLHSKLEATPAFGGADTMRSWFRAYEEWRRNLKATAAAATTATAAGGDVRARDLHNNPRNNLHDHHDLYDLYTWAHSRAGAGYQRDLVFEEAAPAHNDSNSATDDGHEHEHQHQHQHQHGRGRGLRAARLRFMVRSSVDSDAQAEIMHALRGVVDASSLDASVMAHFFAFLERYVKIEALTYQSIGGCLGGVFFVNALFLPLTNALLVTLVVALVVVDLLGLMALWGIMLNIASLVQIVLAVGFSVDYAAHIAEAFSSNTAAAEKAVAESTENFDAAGELKDLDAAEHGAVEGPSRNMPPISSQKKPDVNVTRATLALTELGASVMNGGLSTLVATLVLFSSSYEGYRVMAAMFTGFVGFGLLHGLILLPVLLIFTANLRQGRCPDFCRWLLCLKSL